MGILGTSARSECTL